MKRKGQRTDCPPPLTIYFAFSAAGTPRFVITVRSRVVV
jgi:hypothetical protein